MYIATNLAAARFLWRGPRAWEAVIPLAGVVVAGYVLYHNVHPVPPSPFNLFPYIVGAWLVLGLAAVTFVPSLAPRIRAGIAASEAEQPETA